LIGKEVSMPRRERDREIARRRKRKKESRKLRAKGRLGQPNEPVKETGKKKTGKGAPKEAHQEAPKEASETSTPET